MEKTWASGALELLKHADSHISLDSAFDSRIAFISIDNSVETSIRTYMSLPKKISGGQFSKKEVDNLNNSFPKMVDLLFSKAREKLVGLNEADLEYFHRLRNKLYHEGTGLAVNQESLNAYRQIAAVLLDNLFGIRTIRISNEATLENLILLWNEVEKLIRQKLEESGIGTGHTFKWELAERKGVIEMKDSLRLAELRMIRNTQVHSGAEKIDRKRIALGIEIAETLLMKLREETE